MICWFVGASLAAVWFVFRDPGFDVRPLVLGALLPELDALLGGARVMHSLVFSLFLLVVVMLATIGRRGARKRWLGLPIGTMLHLVVDGAWTDTHVFGWPLGGWGFDDAPLPLVARGWWNIPLEMAGIALLAWCWRAGGLADPARRGEVARTGRLFAPLAAVGGGLRR
ncbi:MAG: hypothetical protein H0W46_02560 [Acidimicrobiia bacterium]|nr:hypothetical protein [Acidimicrobiia bacterium]